MSDFELRPRPFNLNDIPDAIDIVRAAWTFDEMETDIGRVTTAAHYLIKNLAASNIGYTIETPSETDDESNEGRVAGFLLGHIPDLPLPGLLDSDEGREWAKNIDDLWVKQTTSEEREAWARDWFTGEKLTTDKATAAGLMPTSPSKLMLFAVNGRLKGRGIGSVLYNAFMTAHSGFNRDHAVILNTDTWCGWRFYEKHGFTRLAEVPVFEDESEKANADASPIGAFYLYGKLPERISQ